MSYALLSGEQSGDQMGEQLIKRLGPCIGVGGELMQKAGLETLADPLHLMGISDVLLHLPHIFLRMQKIEKALLLRNPQVIVTIDAPDFHLLLAKRLRKKGYRGKILHLVSPSIWAWRKNRVKTLEKFFDHLLLILPFEKAYYANSSLPVTYIGHPLTQFLREHTYKPLSLPPQCVALFPGSRASEIRENLPLQIAATRGAPYVVSVARKELEPLLQSYTDAPLIPSERRYDLMREAHLAIATSGTIALELALHKTPTLVTYRLTPFNYFMGRHIFRIHLPFYSLPNIIAGKEIFPEFIHKKISSADLVRAKERLLANPTPCHTECSALQKILDGGDCFAKAFEVITA